MSVESNSSNQRIPWRRRADLRIAPLEFSGRRSWGVKDPVTLAYFELRDEEYFVLQALDGGATVDQVCGQFHQQFRPRILSPTELLQFIGQLISQGLLVADGPGYGRMLVIRDQQAQARRWWARFSNLLCLRFRGIDPDRMLEEMLSWLGWLFSPAMMVCSILLIVLALTLVVTQFDRVLERLPDAQAMLSPVNLIWLPVLLAAVKVLHELGHGLTCKRFGGECHELGAMLLVFTPTLYCNVSDMWMVRDKWQRIAVSAAGMWVEAVIASTCTLLWWFSAPGLFHSLCLNLMFICGVSTIVFNGNPLLRYDGYFVLADWLEIPNLQQQSAATVRGWLAWWFCGFGDRGDKGQPFSRTGLLLGYGFASMIYRTMLTFLILWSLHLWLAPLGMAVIVQLLAVPLIGMTILSPLSAAVRFFRSAENRSRINWPRFQFRAGLAALILMFVVFVPLPSRVTAGALLDLGDAQRIYATMGGTLESAVKVGDRVEAGQVVARLVEPNIESELIRLEGEYHHHKLRLEQLNRRRVLEPEIAPLIPAVAEAARDFQLQLKHLREQASSLVLRAPCDGVVLPANWQSGSGIHGALPDWSGSPLDPRNRGCLVKTGTTICLVGATESRVAIVLVNQDDMNLVRVGQSVGIIWRELAGELMSGRIVELSALDLELLPRDAVRRLNLPARSNADGSLMPVGTWYQARVQLDGADAPLIRGAVGDASIVIDAQSLSARLYRWLARTFPL
ncbi:MAG: hypothetical protein JSS49_26855 [Planctomycetes bacterium]|nr:hypothetical protein [Planctomycetota bacterium]